ncbi:hypothetical protein KI614_10120 [Dechloromonas denitrificans]|uniref:hypothetical protein n=1 Tax=Dechloromonas denitrificans TaxID=281362 RepID=UPI001CF8B591|nr:hypothetical protein [Dechloromonas denitrificans]UCV10548.1 hypothetical protein KI614_10120 [Dechloromonas denitrificans]
MASQGEYDILDLRDRLLDFLGTDYKAYPVQLEKQFPRILSNLVKLWGTPAFDAYLSGLIVSDRPDRKGFPPEIAVELFHLSSVYDSHSGKKAASGTGWATLDEGDLYKK